MKPTENLRVLDTKTKIGTFLLVFSTISFGWQVVSGNTLLWQSSVRNSQEKQVQSVDVPPDIMRKIMERAELDYPGDQQLRDFVIKQQVDSYQWLQNLPEPRIPEKSITSLKERAATDHPEDYQVQKIGSKNRWTITSGCRIT